MKTKLSVMLAAAGVAAVLLTSCVSSKKYKSSQAMLQQVRNDSTRLAQQVASLNENINSLQQKNTTLQRSLDSSTSSYASQQKDLNYYQDYFNQQQTAMTQVSDQVKGALTQAGLSGDDVQQMNNTVYVRLDEDKIFKKNSTAVSTSGKQALSGLAQAIKSRSDVNVFVSNGDSSASGSMSSSGMDNGSPANMSAGASGTSGASPRHHRTHHAAARRSASGSGSASSGSSASSDATAQNIAQPKPAAAHKKVRHRNYSSEGGMTYYNTGSKTSRSRAWALKQGRMNAVANNFLQNGIPKINLSMEQPALSSNQQSSNIKVIITPTMNDFNPQKNTSASTENK
jgi:hypothetical protein